MNILVRPKSNRAIAGEMTLVCTNPDGGGMICISYHKNFDISFENISTIHVEQNFKLVPIDISHKSNEEIFNILALYYFQNKGIHP